MRGSGFPTMSSTELALPTWEELKDEVVDEEYIQKARKLVLCILL